MKNRVYQLVSLLLLAVFCAVPLIQALHQHDQDALALSGKDPSASVHSYTVKCAVCDFTANQQSRHLNYWHPLVLTFWSGRAVILTLESFPVPVKVSLVSWTNKGPPAII